jgi:hypothetical protein
MDIILDEWRCIAFPWWFYRVFTRYNVRVLFPLYIPFTRETLLRLYMIPQKHHIVCV